MSSRSREIVRDAFAVMLSDALVGSGKPAEVVYGYQVADFGGASPVVVVSSGPIIRRRQSMGACWATHIMLNVQTFVLYSDQSGWNEANAEDALDTIEAGIADVVLSNASNAPIWKKVEYADPSEATGIEIGGVEYRYELIRLNFEVIENG